MQANRTFVFIVLAAGVVLVIAGRLATLMQMHQLQQTGIHRQEAANNSNCKNSLYML